MAVYTGQATENKGPDALAEKIRRFVNHFGALNFSFDSPQSAKLREQSNRISNDLQTLEIQCKQMDEEFEELMQLMPDPASLEIGELETVVPLLVSLDCTFNNSTESAEKLAQSLSGYLGISTFLSNVLLTGPKDAFLLQKCARQAARLHLGRLGTERCWQDHLFTMKFLGELGKRRPLTKEEKILMNNASVIYTPVVQDPSDSREDWYDYDD